MNRILILVNSVAILLGISYGMHGPILPLFAKNTIGASYADLGLIGFASFLPYVFIPLFVGILLDRYNNGRFLAIGAGLNSISFYLLSVAQSVPEIAGFRIITGVAHGFFWPSCISIISAVSHDKDRVNNIAKFTGFFIAGFTIGPLLGSFFLEQLDVTYRVLFQITAFVAALSIITPLFLSSQNIKRHYEKFSFSALKEMARFPEIIVILIYSTASFGMILAIYPAFLDDNHISGTQIEILYFVFGLSRILTLVVANKLARYTSVTLVISMLSIASGLLLSITSSDMVNFAIALSLMGFGFSAVFPLTIQIILCKTRKSIAGSMIGAYETTFGVGWILGPILAGLLSHYFLNSTPYVIFFIFGVLVSMMAVIRRDNLEPPKTGLK